MRALAAALAVLPGTAQAACRLALALALDVSGSVDEREYALQLQGVATALEDEAVQGILLATPETPVALAVYEWSSTSHQRIIQPWREVRSKADLDAIRTTLRDWRRVPAPEATGLGAALVFGRDLLAAAPDCREAVLDVSGDGKNNDWPVPERLKDAGDLAGLRINALVVTSARAEGGGELITYFRTRIIQGPGAFTEVARGFDAYADAMRRKLLREISALPVGSAPPARRLTVAGRGDR